MEDSSQLECHFKWFNELNGEQNGQWLPDLLKKQLHNDLRGSCKAIDNIEQHHDDDESVDHSQLPMDLNSHRSAVLSWGFTLVLRNTFEGNFTEAFKLTNKLLDVEEAKNPSQPQEHIDTFYSVVLANQLNILERWLASADDCPMDQSLPNEIAARMEPLRKSLDSNIGKAFISGMKSNLSRDMLNSELRIKFAKEATELNPQFSGWHQSLYYASRQMRRSLDFRQPASQQEINACNKAYELDAAQTGTVIAMARMYGELLSFCRRGEPNHKEVSEQAIKFARETVRLKPTSKILKMRLARLLSGRQIFSRSKELYAEAEQIVKEVEIGDCCSQLCHLIGKFYSNSNDVIALEWFERALEAHRKHSRTEIIEKIDSLLSGQQKRHFKCKLMFTKAFYLWGTDHYGALDLWLMAMEEADDLKINFINFAAFNFYFQRDRNPEQALKTMVNVNNFMQRRTPPYAWDDASFVKLRFIVNVLIYRLDRQIREPRYWRS